MYLLTKMIVEDNFGLEYQLDPISRTAKIISFKDNTESIIIRRSIIYNFIKYLITEIGKSVFSQKVHVKSIIFASDSAVKTIKKESFGLSSITSLTLPASIETLEPGWCEESNELINIKISPNNKRYTYFDEKMILGKSDTSTNAYDVLVFVRRDATNVKIPSFVKHIDASCFDGCTKIDTLTICQDSELRSIGKCAFANSSIKKMIIPSKFEIFKEGWCEDATELNEIIVSKNNPNFIVDENQFVLGKSYDIKVYDVVYFAPRKIQKIRIPSFVKHLNSYAFDKCSEIKSIEFEENSKLTSIGSYCFFECKFDKILFPSSLQKIDMFAFSGSAIEEVDFGENSELSTIENSAFLDSSIRKILLPASLKSIGASSFSCDISDIQFKKNSKLELIEYGCFSNSPITQISIPSTIKSIDHAAFANCGSLAIAEIPDDGDVKTLYLCHDSFYNNSKDFVLFISPFIDLVILGEDEEDVEDAEDAEDYD